MQVTQEVAMTCVRLTIIIIIIIIIGIIIIVTTTTQAIIINAIITQMWV